MIKLSGDIKLTPSKDIFGDENLKVLEIIQSIDGIDVNLNGNVININIVYHKNGIVKFDGAGIAIYNLTEKNYQILKGITINIFKKYIPSYDEFVEVNGRKIEPCKTLYIAKQLIIRKEEIIETQTGHTFLDELYYQCSGLKELECVHY